MCIHIYIVSTIRYLPEQWDTIIKIKWFFCQVKKKKQKKQKLRNYLLPITSFGKNQNQIHDNNNSQILLIESCGFYFWNTLFQQLSSLQKSPLLHSAYSHWLAQLHSVYCGSVKTTSCSTNVTFQSFLVVKGQHRDEKQSNAINCSHSERTLIVTMATVARDISYIW